MASKAVTIALALCGCAAHETQASVHIEELPTPPPVASVTHPSAAATAAPASNVLPDGLEIQDVRLGTGAELTNGATAVVHYVGTLDDGTEFDSSRRRKTPFTSKIPGQLIKGWNEGLPGMRVGGLRRLIIPPSLAYGDRAVSTIPAGSTLTFEIELLEVRQP